MQSDNTILKNAREGSNRFRPTDAESNRFRPPDASAGVAPVTDAVPDVSTAVTDLLEHVVCYIQKAATHNIRRFGPTIAAAGVRIGKGLGNAALSLPATIYSLDKPQKSGLVENDNSGVVKRRKAAFLSRRHTSGQVCRTWQSRDKRKVKQ
jgi:hypothetical protein